jgi:outer membrane protein OmpA-like peptidoglycan-associated protein
MLKSHFVLVLVVLAWVTLPALAQNQHQFELKATLNGGHVGKVQNIRFSPDGRMLASGGHDGRVVLWDVATAKPLRSIAAHFGIIFEVTFNKDGSLLASASDDGTAKVWEVKTGRCLGTFFNKPFLFPTGLKHSSVSFVVFSPDSRNIYFSGDNGYVMKGELKPGPDGRSKPASLIYNCNYGDGRWYSTVTGGCISGDEQNLVVTVGQLVVFIDLETEIMAKFFRYGEEQASFSEEHLNDVVVGPQAGTVATWSYDGKVNLWNVQQGRVTKTFQVSNPEQYSAASFSKDGKLLVTGVGGPAANGAKVWDVATGREVANLSGHGQTVRITRFSPTENLIATGSYDVSIKLWKLKETDVPVVKKEPEPVVAKNESKPQPKPKPEPKPQPKPEPKPQPKEPEITFNDQKIELGKAITLENIMFEQSSFVLRRESFDELDKLLQFMKKNPTVEIELAGHTDNVGDPTKNQTLSERRVLNVKNFLVQRGIAEPRIATVAYGGSRPVASNDNEAGRQKNRRVEMRALRF